MKLFKRMKEFIISLKYKAMLSCCLKSKKNTENINPGFSKS